MKIIGLIGGMSWESTAEYYRIINETIKRQLGGLHSGKILLYSVDFHEIEKLQHEGKWKEATAIMVDAARRVQNGGADFLLICTNTMHRMASEVQGEVDIPLLHIADATAEAIKDSGIQRVGLLGTKYTMEEDFYKGRLISQHHLDVLVPDEGDRKIIHEVIYKELCLGTVLEKSKNEFARVIDDLAQQGAEGIILGCTEISLLVKPSDSALPLFDTTKIHAEKAVEFALKNGAFSLRP